MANTECKLIYLTRDVEGYVDVWTERPSNKRYGGPALSVWGLWDAPDDWVAYVGEFKDEIVQRVFGTLPADNKQCVEVEVDPQRVLLTNLLDELNKED